MLEAKVEAALNKGAMQRGGLALKVVCQGRKGFPDRFLAMPLGRLYLVELKKPKGGVLSDSQERMHHKLRQRCTPVYLLWSIEEVEDFWRQYDEGTL